MSNQNYAFQEENPSHTWRTEIPNIIEEHIKDPYAFRVYMHIKRRAGDGGRCTESKKNMAAACGMSERKLDEAKKILSQNHPLLENRPLIRVTKRKTNEGDWDTDMITVIDMWDINILKFSEIKKVYGGAQDAPGVVHDMHQGGAGGAPKEEPLKKNNLKKNTTTSESQDVKISKDFKEIVVVFSSLKRITIPDTLKQKITRDHTEQEVDQAVERCLKWEGRTNDEVGILTVLKKGDEWNDVESKEEIEGENIEYLRKLDHLDNTQLGPMRVVVGEKYIEFVAGMQCVRYETADKDFIHLVAKYLNNK